MLDVITALKTQPMKGDTEVGMGWERSRSTQIVLHSVQKAELGRPAKKIYCNNSDGIPLMQGLMAL